MPEEIGALSERVTFQVEATVGDGGGGTKKAWQDYATSWAEVWPVSGRERLQAGQLSATASHRLRVARRDDITEAMRVVWPGHPEPGQVRYIGRVSAREAFMVIDVEFGAQTGGTA